jgi:hypothetical protein
MTCLVRVVTCLGKWGEGVVRETEDGTGDSALPALPGVNNVGTDGVERKTDRTGAMLERYRTYLLTYLRS